MTDESPLLVLGVSLEEQKAYEFLLANPGSTAADVARDARWSTRRAGRVLKSLEANGMANCLPERTPRYLPTPPEVALDLLTTRKQEELQRARAVAGRWQSKVRRPSFEEQVIDCPGRYLWARTARGAATTAHNAIESAKKQILERRVIFPHFKDRFW